MKTTQFLFMLALSCVAFHNAAPAADWYVSPAGGGTGTSPASPMLPQYAINSATSGDRILFSAGTYPVGASYGLGIQVSGKTLTFVGIPGGGAVLDLGLPAGTVNIVSGSSVTMTDMIIENGATTWGQVWIGSHLDLIRSTVRGFTSAKAFIITTDSTARFSECHFEANVIGIVVSDGSDVEVEASTFATHTTAGIYFLDSSPATKITKSEFLNNVDGLHMLPSYSDTECLVQHNVFSGNGCGIALLSTSGGYVARDRIRHNEFSGSTSSAIYSGYGNNQADIEGNWIQGNNRGLYLQGTSDTVHNNVIVDSTGAGGAGTGHGIEVVAATAKVAYNTIAYNAIHGILARTGDASRYVNNVSYNNAGHGIRILGSAAAQVGFNDTFLNAVNLSGVFAGLGGNIFVPPGFIGAYDFHLLAASPLINAANAALFPETLDFDGKLRVPGPTDIGAFEH